MNFSIIDALLNVIGVILVLFAAHGYGSWLVERIGYRDKLLAEYFLFSFGLGMGVISLLILLIGLAKLLYPLTGWLVIFIGLVLATINFKNNGKAIIQSIKGIRYPRNWYVLALILILFINLLFPLLANAFIPPVHYDEAAYHLAVPKIYIRDHQLAYIPFIPQSNWPLGSEMLFTVSLLLFHSETVAKLITYLFFLGAVSGILLFGHRTFGHPTGILAVALFTISPVVLYLSGTALVEMPLTFYFLMATIALFMWLDQDNPVYWILSAIFIGFAASIKLNAVSLAIVLGFVVFAMNLINRKKTIVSAFLAFIKYGLVALIVVLPWYMKSWFHTGNPVWPFFYEYLGGRNWDQLGSINLLAFIQAVNMPMTLKNWLTGIWQITNDPLRFGPFRIGWYYLILLPFSIPPLFLINDRVTKQKLRWLALIGILGYTTWFLQTHQTRFLVPIIWIFAVLISAGLIWFSELDGKKLLIISQIGIVIALIAGSWLFSYQDFSYIKSNIPYLSGNQSRDEFLSSRINAYDVFKYANDNLATNSLIWLAVWESRGYYLDRDYEWANPISQRVIKMEQFSSASELAAALHQRGITHIIFSTDFLDSLTNYPYIEQDIKLVQQLIQENGKEIYRSGPDTLYELVVDH